MPCLVLLWTGRLPTAPTPYSCMRVCVCACARAGGRERQRVGRQADGGGALLPRHAHLLHRHRPAAAGAGRVGRAARGAARRHRQRRAQGVHTPSHRHAGMQALCTGCPCAPFYPPPKGSGVPVCCVAGRTRHAASFFGICLGRMKPSAMTALMSRAQAGTEDEGAVRHSQRGCT